MGCEPRAFLNHWDEIPAAWSDLYKSTSVQQDYIYVLESIMGKSTTFPLLACSKLMGWIVQRKQIITVVFCKYNCPLPQVQDETLLPWLISRCHNLSLSISWLGYILNAFQIHGGELSCFTCIDHLCNLTHCGLKHLPLQIHPFMRFKKGKRSLLCIADHLLVMKIILEERGGCSQ